MNYRIPLLLALLTGPVHAEPVHNSIPIDDLTNQSDMVIVGAVLTTRDNLDADGLWTVATVRVAETLRGSPEMVVDVRVPGGRIDDFEMQVMGAPTLIPGDEVLLFLNGDRVVGFGQGAFVVSEERAWRAIKDWGFMHPSRLNARGAAEDYYVSLDLRTVREQVSNEEDNKGTKKRHAVR